MFKILLSSFVFHISLATNVYAEVSYEDFKELKNITQRVFNQLKTSSQYSLFINKQPTSYANPGSPEERYWWGIDLINASFFKIIKEEHTEYYITVFGGFALQDSMDADALAVTLCHELAHGLGGSPHKDNGTTTEGQADYFATKICLPIFFDFYKSEMKHTASSGYIEDLCQRENRRSNHKYCIRALNALHADIGFFKLLGENSYYDRQADERPSSYNTSDTFYPSAQCRLDLMIHGVLGLEQPNCFNPQGIDRVL